MFQPNFETITHKIIHMSLGVEGGENGVLMVRSDAIAYANILAQQAHLVGSTVLMLLMSDDLRYREIMETPRPYLSLPTAPLEAALQRADYYILLGVEHSAPSRFRTLPPERVRAYAERQHHYEQILATKEGLRGVSTDFPTQMMADSYGMGWSEFYESYWQAMDCDYGLLRERVAALAEAIERAQHFTLEAPNGTTLTFDRRATPVVRKDGRARPNCYLPAGEVVFAPADHSMNGTLIFDGGFLAGTTIRTLHMQVEDGVMTPLDAEAGFEAFMAADAPSAGHGWQPMDIGIGLNPAVIRPLGLAPLDRTTMGLLHMTVGMRTDADKNAGSERRVPLYISQATLSADDVVLLDRGRFPQGVP